MLADMTVKQKVTAGLTVVIFIFVVWQVIAMMGSGSSSTPKPNPVAPKPNQGAPMTANAPAGPDSPAAETPNQNEEQQQIKQVSVGMNNQLLEVQKESEKKYIDQLNQLQMLKIQREIAETNQAIAKARLETVTAEKGVSDVLTKPAPTPVPMNVYANSLENPAMQGAPVANAQPQPAPQIVDNQYVVISVSMESGKWSAVLGNQGKLYNVSVGDVLPVDGSTISSINGSSVVLEKDGKKKKISIVSQI